MNNQLDERICVNERQKKIDRFKTDKDSFLFFLSTWNGGVEIDLMAADIFIIFYSARHPHIDVQAQARCHRIVQTKAVVIYQLLTSRISKQEIFDRASNKFGLEQAVLETLGQGNKDEKPLSEEMEKILAKGASDFGMTLIPKGG